MIHVDLPTADPGDPIQHGTFDPEALGVFGETLTLAPAGEGVREIPLEQLSQGKLAAIVDDHATSLGGVDTVVAASSWTNHLATLLVPGPLTAWTLWDVGLDASPANLSVHLEGSRPVRCRVLDPQRVARGSARDRTPSSLLDDTMRKLAETSQAAMDLPEPLSWGHVGNVCAYLFDRLEELGLGAGEQDRRRLLDVSEPGWCRGTNPLAGTVGYEPMPELPELERYQVRTTCCLKHRLPDKDPCASCPRITAERRLDLVEERRGRL